MHISPFFLELRSGYEAELDDLRYDSEGRDVLRMRLTQKRKELGFLLQMIELSPEMVAVVLHRGFRFRQTAAMDHLLTLEPDEFPAWDSLTDAVALEPWAGEIAQVVLEEPMGEWFLTLSAALEYMLAKPVGAPQPDRAEDADADGESDRDEARNGRHDDHHTEDHDEEEQEARAREEAGNDWMVAQGFDRKD